MQKIRTLRDVTLIVPTGTELELEDFYAAQVIATGFVEAVTVSEPSETKPITSKERK
jgi:hypothetical protein